jgi:hypothetical protein
MRAARLSICEHTLTRQLKLRYMQSRCILSRLAPANNNVADLLAATPQWEDSQAIDTLRLTHSDHRLAVNCPAQRSARNNSSLWLRIRKGPLEISDPFFVSSQRLKDLRSRLQGLWVVSTLG